MFEIKYATWLDPNKSWNQFKSYYVRNNSKTGSMICTDQDMMRTLLQTCH